MLLVGAVGSSCLLHASLILWIRSSTYLFILMDWLIFLCVYRYVWVLACLTLHACGIQRITSAVVSHLLPYFEVGLYCFSITGAMLAGLWASGDSPVFAYHFNIDMLGLQICAWSVPLLCMFWRFELRSSGLHGTCCFPWSHLSSLSKTQHYHGKGN